MPYFWIRSDISGPFTDTEGRFPQLQHLAEYLQNHGDGRIEYLFALVLPREMGGRSV